MSKVPAFAIVLAAGLGTRMRPLTDTRPKPLIEVAGKALIDHNLDWLGAAGVSRAVVNVSYLGEQLEAHLGNRNTPAVVFSREETPLETGGGILKALKLLGGQPFVAMNSDAIFPLAEGAHPLARLAAEWDEDIDFAMLLVPKAHAVGWEGKGDFVMDEDRIRWPKPGEDAPYVFSGVEIIHPRVFAGHAPGKFPLRELWKRSEGADGFHTRIRAIVHEGPWLNVGDLAGLKAAEDYFGGVTGRRTSASGEVGAQ